MPSGIAHAKNIHAKAIQAIAIFLVFSMACWIYSVTTIFLLSITLPDTTKE